MGSSTRVVWGGNKKTTRKRSYLNFVSARHDICDRGIIDGRPGKERSRNLLSGDSGGKLSRLRDHDDHRFDLPRAALLRRPLPVNCGLSVQTAGVCQEDRSRYSTGRAVSTWCVWAGTAGTDNARSVSPG